MIEIFALIKNTRGETGFDDYRHKDIVNAGLSECRGSDGRLSRPSSKDRHRKRII